uniref:Uncharacterized protein n=1 Tax=Myotis lucifugus TaxID=59463 RepID=G1Q8S7_MYOLU
TGSESKPCVQPFDPGAAALTTNSSRGSWRPEHLEFSTMGDEQEEAGPGQLGESTEDLSLDWGALQGSEYLQDLGLEAPAHRQPGAARESDPPSEAAGSGSSCSSPAGPQGLPRRCSWARSRSCSDSWQRFSLDSSAVSEGPCLPRALATLALNLPGESLQAWTKECLSGGRTPAKHPGKEGDGLEERVRSQSVPVTLDEVSALESSRALEVPTHAAQGSPAWCFPLGPSRAAGLVEVLGEGFQRAREPPASALLYPLPQGSGAPPLPWPSAPFSSSEDGASKMERSDRGITRAKCRLSSLRSRVTRHKDKGKSPVQLKDKDQDARERKECVNGHQLSRGAVSGHAPCPLCSSGLLLRALGTG